MTHTWSQRAPSMDNFWARFAAAAATILVLTLVAAVCANLAEPAAPTTESLGLAMDVEIQAGSTFEVVVLMEADTMLAVASAPPGVDASITRTSDGTGVMMKLAVDPDTPRGAYGLALVVVQDGDEHYISWPFEVAEPGS